MSLRFVRRLSTAVVVCAVVGWAFAAPPPLHVANAVSRVGPAPSDPTLLICPHHLEPVSHPCVETVPDSYPIGFPPAPGTGKLELPLQMPDPGSIGLQCTDADGNLVGAVGVQISYDGTGGESCLHRPVWLNRPDVNVTYRIGGGTPIELADGACFAPGQLPDSVLVTMRNVPLGHYVGTVFVRYFCCGACTPPEIGPGHES